MAIEALKQVWPEWQVEEKPLGRGAFGVVYKGVRRDHNVESYAAIKVISIPADPSDVDSLRSEGLDLNATKTYLQGIVDDFVSEIQLMESLKGIQNIVSVEDYKVVEKPDEVGWDIFIRMELLTSFNSYICDRKMTEQEVIKLGCDICTALEICSQRNIIHRDIKPENIFLNDFGDFKLGDFGIARKMENVSGGLSQKGTPDYMAPEVVSGREYDARVDIYSLGLVLYRMLNNKRLPFLDTSKQLFTYEDKKAALERRFKGEQLPPPCEASPEMADVILRACAFLPGNRYASAKEMKDALQRVANGTYQIGSAQPLEKTMRLQEEQPEAAAPGKPARKDKKAKGKQKETGAVVKKKKRKWPLVVLLLLIVAAVAAAGVYFLPGMMKTEGKPTSAAASASSEASSATTGEDKIASILSEAEKLATAGDYEGALAKVKSGLITYPESADLQSKQQEYAGKVKDNAIAEAATLADSEDYLGAIALIEKAQKNMPDDADLKTTYDGYVSLYVDGVIAEAENLAQTGDYDGAIEKCKSAAEGYTNDKLQEEIDKLEKGKPVQTDVTSLKEVDSNSFSFGSEQTMITDTYGNTYNDPMVFDGSSAYVTYLADGQYSSLVGTIAAHDNMKHDYSSIITIYADDTLLYTSPTISRTTEPVEVSLDITGAKLITIKSDGSNDYYDNAGAVLKLSVSTGAAAPAQLQSSLTFKPTQEISDLKIVDSDAFSFDEKRPLISDTYGNTYDGPIVFDGKSSYVSYFADGQYTSLTGTIAAHDEMKHDYSAIISIYADDTLLYTSPSITRTTEPVPVSLDITGAKLITIKSDGSNDYYDNAGAIMKLTVK